MSDAMPIGTYYAERLAQSGVALNANNKPFIFLCFNLTHYADDNGAWEPLGETVQRDVRWYLSENARPYTEEKLEKLGFNGDYGDPQFNSEKVNGVNLVCTHRDSDGKTYEDWDIDGLGGFERKEADINTIRTLNAQWKTRQAANRKPAPVNNSNPPQSKPQQTEGQSPPAQSPKQLPNTNAESAKDDDLPF